MKWASTFKYLPIEYGENIAYAENLTQNVSFDNNIEGNQIRIRFTNRYGKNVLHIKKATIGKQQADYITDRTIVTLQGQQEIKLSPRQEAMSDEVSFPAKAGDRLVVSLYVEGHQDMDTICCYWADGGAEVACYQGDATEVDSAEKAGFTITAPYIRDDANVHMMRMFIGFDAVQVLTQDETKVIAAYGDSITHMSFYTNALHRRLCEEETGKVCMINSGIGGNRLLDDPTVVDGKPLVFFGKAGVDRFEKDVFELDEVDAVLRELAAEGKLKALAEKYGIEQDAIMLK